MYHPCAASENLIRSSHRILVTGMSLHLIVGPMFSGKSSKVLELIHKYNAINWPVFVITHSIDTRYATMDNPKVCSHDQETAPAYVTNTLSSVREERSYQTARVVLIEEAQFFTGLKEFVLQAVETEKKTVICVGLDGDTHRKPFGEMLELVPFCDTIEKRNAFCKRCKEPIPALFTARKITAPQSLQQIQVGGTDLYEPLCRIHYLEDL